MPDYQNAIDVRMEPLTDWLRKVCESVQDVRIDPTPELFVWKVWLNSTSKILGTVSVAWIDGTNAVDQAKAKLCQQIDGLLRHRGVVT